MVTRIQKRKSKGSTKRFIGRPAGQIQERVQAVGPEHFGVIAIDCAKRRSKWMLCNFYGKILVAPTTVEHTTGALRLMTQLASEACRGEGLTDTIVAVEMTGIYHKPVQRAFRKAGFDTRIVHPFASNHYRRPLHPDQKTDDHDLEAIFHAAVKGYGLATLPVSEVYQSLQAASRHRHNLVKQRSRLMVQMRRLLHQTMPGFADLFENDHLFHKSIAIPIALQFSSAEAIRRAGVAGIESHLKRAKVRFQARTIERIVAWAGTAAESSELAAMHTRQWQQLNEVRQLFERQIEAAEREMAGFLVKTPYVLLLSVTGINVVSAARLAGEAGSIEHYASARAINGRAGLYPSRYQSDAVDHADGSLVRQCNRQLRGAAMLVAENLIKCHTYYRGLSALWAQRNVDPRDRRCRIANRAMRMVYQLVGGRQVWRGRGVDREYLLFKLREFHRLHDTPIGELIRDLNEAYVWLPKSEHAAEARPLAELVTRKRRGPEPIGNLLIPLLIRLGLTSEELGIADAQTLESNMSEARSSG
ncbi:MAG: transposase [Pseudomonas sp.]|uniref:IS110 family transposase n=1 Tax=Pseudomonas sp. TaxID=306 RepID=UPI003C75A793